MMIDYSVERLIDNHISKNVTSLTKTTEGAALENNMINPNNSPATPIVNHYDTRQGNEVGLFHTGPRLALACTIGRQTSDSRTCLTIHSDSR